MSLPSHRGTPVVLLGVMLSSLLVASIATPVLAAEEAGNPDSLESLADAAPEQESNENEPFVYNGESVANTGWVAAILDQGFYMCSAVLVDPQWILTAAHCVEEADSLYRINVGSDRWFQGHQRRLAQVHIHPNYEVGVNESVDLAMVKLDSSIPASALPTLASSAAWPLINQPLVVVGWGQTYDNSPVPDLLQGAGVWANSDSSGAVNEPFCPTAWVAASGFEDFCFGGSSWACPGDSGGPLIGYASPQVQSGPVETIYGLTSYGDAAGCSSAFFDSVAQSVGPHLTWIRNFYAAGATPGPGDEMFFYREDGLYRFYDVRNDGSLTKPIRAGEEFTKDWSTIAGVDLEGDGFDEMFFYREDGLFRFYDVRPDGSLPSPIYAGDNYTKEWTAITAIDLNGDGQDEMFFYRDDGLYRFYDVRPNGTIGSPLSAGDTYTTGWDSITAIDLDGDGQDEMFFYREDGLYRFYNIRADGSLPKPMLAGDNYTTGWDSITAVDLEGNGQDEMFFYRDDGLYRFYNIRADGSLPKPMLAGDNYTTGWSSITAVDLSD